MLGNFKDGVNRVEIVPTKLKLKVNLFYRSKKDIECFIKVYWGGLKKPVVTAQMTLDHAIQLINVRKLKKGKHYGLIEKDIELNEIEYKNHYWHNLFLEYLNVRVDRIYINDEFFK